ncbi:peroxisomal sarcosine oxidase-like [Diadema antillarum]|uniref:peroxisomal sarcosine oxidase-like n=1 Tax=Diadema antillarum TaxID=105358 RepID=UPI003A895AC0
MASSPRAAPDNAPDIHGKRSLYDVVVVGAGVQGSATAYQCAKEGLKTVLLEQFSLPHTRGSSHGQSRIIRYSYDQPHYAEMMLEAFPMWAQLEKETNTVLYKKTGLLTVSLHPTGALYHKSLKQMRKYNRGHKVLDHKTLKRDYPQLSLPQTALAFLDYDGGTLRADKALRALQTAFVNHGGILYDCQKVVQIIPGTTVRVVTEDREFCGKSLVLTPGAWASPLLKPLGLDPPLEVWRINVPYWREKECGGMKTFPNVIIESEETGSHIYSIQSLEYPGMTKVAYHGGSDCVDPDCRDDVPPGKKEEVEYLKRSVSKYYSALESEPSIIETCMYTNTPDDELIIDRHPVYPNIAVCCGCSGHGFKLAPSVGKILCHLAMGKEPHINIAALSFKRFKNSCMTHSSKL